jgi:hypothetical protein
MEESLYQFDGLAARVVRDAAYRQHRDPGLDFQQCHDLRCGDSGPDSPPRVLDPATISPSASSNSGYREPAPCRRRGGGPVVSVEYVEGLDFTWAHDWESVRTALRDVR